MSESTLTLHVPDMSCGHCRASITQALAPMGLTPAFDPERRLVTLPIADAQVVIETLARIGFEAESVSG